MKGDPFASKLGVPSEYSDPPEQSDGEPSAVFGKICIDFSGNDDRKQKQDGAEKCKIYDIHLPAALHLAGRLYSDR